MNTQLKSALKWAFYGIIAIGSVAGAVILASINPNILLGAIGVGLFSFIGIAVIAQIIINPKKK